MVASKIAFLSLLASLAAAAPTPQIVAPVTTPRGYPAGVITLGPGSSVVTTWPNNQPQWDRQWPYNGQPYQGQPYQGQPYQGQPWRDYDDDDWEPPRGWRSGPRSGPRGPPVVISTTPGVSSSLDISK